MADKYVPGMEFQSWTSLPSGDQKPGALGKFGAYLIDQTGIKDFLDKNFGDSEASNIEGAKIPPASKYALQPSSPISQQGISPMRLPNAVPGGVGLNASPAGAVNPFQFQISPQPNALPDDEHRNQVKSAWS
jgi:hypothetical protein